MEKIDQIIEALLFASPEPLTQKKVNSIFDNNAPDLKSIINKINNKYATQDHGIEILEIAGGFQIRTKSDLM